MKSLLTYITEAASTKYIKLLQKFIEPQYESDSHEFLSPDTILPYGNGSIQDLVYVGDRKRDTVIHKENTKQTDLKPLMGMVEFRGKTYLVLRTYGSSFHNNLIEDAGTTSFIGGSNGLHNEDVFLLVDLNSAPNGEKLRMFNFTDPREAVNLSYYDNNHLSVGKNSTSIYTFYNEKEKKDWVHGEETSVNDARGLFEDLSAANVELYTINVKSYRSVIAGPGMEDNDEYKEYINELQKPLLKSDAITKELSDWYDELTEKLDWFKDHKVGIRIDSKTVADLRSSIDDILEYIKTTNKDIMSFKQGKIKKIDSLSDLEDNLGVISYYCKTVVPHTSQKKLIPLVTEFDRSISSDPSKIHQTIIEPFKVKLPASKMSSDIPSFKMNSRCEVFLELVGVLYKLDTKAQTRYEKYLKTIK